MQLPCWAHTRFRAGAAQQPDSETAGCDRESTVTAGPFPGAGVLPPRDKTVISSRRLPALLKPPLCHGRCDSELTGTGSLKLRLVNGPLPVALRHRELELELSWASDAAAPSHRMPRTRPGGLQRTSSRPVATGSKPRSGRSRNKRPRPRPALDTPSRESLAGAVTVTHVHWHV